MTDRFEAAYRGEPPWEDAGPPPWDIGEPQPTVVELEDAGRIRGRVLDSGCGTGENALYLADRGHPVTGVDAAPTAISRARDKAGQRGLPVELVVADVLDLTGYAERFDTVIDSGVFHTFDDEDRVRYVAALHRVCRPGGVVHVLCFSDAEPPGWGPRRISKAELRDAFSDGWALETLRPAEMVGRRPGQDHPGGIRAWLASARRS